MKKLITGLALSLCLTACVNTPPSAYYWGNYEQLVYDMYKNPGKATPAIQLQKLSNDIEIAQSKGKQVPPGVYAHIGMLYASIGDAGNAKAALEQELHLYPESAIFVDGLIQRMEKGVTQ